MQYSDGKLLDMLLELDIEEIKVVCDTYLKKHENEFRLGLSKLCYQVISIKQDEADRVYMADLIQKAKSEKKGSHE